MSRAAPSYFADRGETWGSHQRRPRPSRAVDRANLNFFGRTDRLLTKPCGVVWAVWCGGVGWRDVGWSVEWSGDVWYGEVWYGMVWCGVVRCDAVWCGVLQCGAVGCGAMNETLRSDNGLLSAQLPRVRVVLVGEGKHAKGDPRESLRRRRTHAIGRWCMQSTDGACNRRVVHATRSPPRAEMGRGACKQRVHAPR